MKGSVPEKYLKQKSWFHGTTLSGFESLCRQSVLADYNRGNSLDFGDGFYPNCP